MTHITLKLPWSITIIWSTYEVHLSFTKNIPATCRTRIILPTILLPSQLGQSNIQNIILEGEFQKLCPIKESKFVKKYVLQKKTMVVKIEKDKIW